jgi:SAM-dependent methyltransferase
MDAARRLQLSYDRVAAQFFARNRDRSALIKWMHRFCAALPHEGGVLDLGAGPCHDSAELRKLGRYVVSLDRSRQMLSVTRDDFPGPRVQADLRQLPFRRHSLAGVWASASLLHLERCDLRPALAEIARVLVADGVLFVSLKDGDGERWESASYGEEAPRWFTYWNAGDIDDALAANGFTTLESVTRKGSKETWHIRLARKAR